MGAHRDDPEVERLRLAAFARRLVGADRGEDLAQETLSVALARTLPSSGPYLFGLMRNVARQEARAMQRRRAREAHAARPNRVESTATLALALERMRVVGEAVAALPDAERRVVRLRYYEGIRAADIARRQGVPSSTVRNRIRRALLRLRATLEGAFGGDPRRSPLLPLLRSPARRIGRWPIAAGVALLLSFAGRGLAGTAEQPPPPPERFAPPVVPLPAARDVRPVTGRASPQAPAFTP